MLYVERLIKHFREADGEDIFYYIFFGFLSIMIVFLLGLAVWGLWTALGIYMIFVPVAIALALLVAYGIGMVVTNFLRKHDPYL
jgi:hypothetical protein